MELAFPLLILGLTALQQAYSLKVNTTQGVIIGNAVKVGDVLVDEYLGIPYAKPPVGDLRFKKPEAIPPFHEPFNALALPPGCPQYETVVSQSIPESEQSEDCLYLNIWAPRTAWRRKSVLFWIHGGGFAVSGTRLDVFNGSALAATGDVVVVTINYRLNAFGFLYSGTEDAPGNVGLHDVLLSLKWVKRNIFDFGGNPNNITLFGQSEGSIIVGTLALSPLAKGFYNRIIMESGAPTYLEGNNATKNMMLTQDVAEEMFCADYKNNIWVNPKGIVNCLRTRNAHDIAKATALVNPFRLRIFQPQYGDDIVPKDTRQAVLDGDFNRTDVLIGDVADEGSLILIRGREKEFGRHGENNTMFFKCRAKHIIQEQLSDFGNVDEITDYYIEPLISVNRMQIRRHTYRAIGDKMFACPDTYFAEQYAGKNNTVYFYVFAHRPSNSENAEWTGVSHFSDVQFVFGQPVLHPEKYTEEEVQLANYMMNAWIKFAKTGNPGEEWPRYTVKDPRVLMIKSAKDHVAVPQPFTKNCDLYRPYFGFQRENITLPAIV